MDRGVLPLLSPEVHNQLLRFVEVEGVVHFLAPLRQVPHLLPVGCLVIAGNVVSSANLMIGLVAVVATKSWVNRVYRRGLSMHP